jgi:hypothetical protein
MKHRDHQENPMKSTLLHAAFGLSVLTSMLGAPRPASAAVLKNLVNENLVTSTGTGYCLGVSGGNTQPGTGLKVWQCNGNADQTWTPITYSGSYIKLHDGINADELCADLSFGSFNNGVQLVTWYCNSPISIDSQGWEKVFQGYDFNGHACYYYKNQKYFEATGKLRVFGVSGGNVTNGTNVQIWDWLAHSDQIWCDY